jgi:hypothetical protein
MSTMAKNKARSDEAFNAAKEIEAMKRLMLHRVASSLQCFWCPASMKTKE